MISTILRALDIEEVELWENLIPNSADQI